MAVSPRSQGFRLAASADRRAVPQQSASVPAGTIAANMRTSGPVRPLHIEGRLALDVLLLSWTTRQSPTRRILE